MSWVIVRSGDGKYVSKEGSQHSYTSKLERAQLFSSKESAQNQCCGNEHVVSVNSILGD